MLNILHSFYKPVCLILLAILGLVCGHLVDTILLVNMRPTVTTVTAVDRLATPSLAKTPEADLNLILQKNIFDTNNRSTGTTIQSSAGAGRGNERAPAELRADLKLFGTVVADERSQVLIKVNKELKLYHLGDKIPGDGTIEAIRRNQVDIRNRDQSLTTLTLHEKAPVSGRGTVPAAKVNRDADAAVKEVGENRWQISRSAIESVRENFADQMRLAQMQPRMVDGKTDGFLVRSINPRSLLAKVGLRRGDVIIDVNNIKLDSPEKGLQVFQQLREARQINVAVERKGQPMSFVYEIE
jgi:general secretion pathway protein C